MAAHMSMREMDTASMASSSSFQPIMNRYLEQQQSAPGTAIVPVASEDNISLEEFKGYVRKWLELDNFLRKAQETVREKRKQRDALSQVIVKFMCKFNIEDLNTKEGRIRCKVGYVKAPVNQKVIKQRLTDYFGDKEQEKNEVLAKIYEERDVSEKVSLRRLKIT